MAVCRHRTVPGSGRELRVGWSDGNHEYRIVSQVLRERAEAGTRVIETIPPDTIDWTPKVGFFTFGDLIRHIAAIERYMFAENARGNCIRGATGVWRTDMKRSGGFLIGCMRRRWGY